MAITIPIGAVVNVEGIINDSLNNLIMIVDVAIR